MLSNMLLKSGFVVGILLGMAQISEKDILYLNIVMPSRFMAPFSQQETCSFMHSLTKTTGIFC